MVERRRERVDRSRYELVLAEDFTGPILDTSLWIPHYLPQWTTPDRSAARYEVKPGWLRLRIDADQPAWRSQDGELRVSNIQTGTYSGPVGSDRGTHRHRPDLKVRTAQPTGRTFTPSSGLVEARLRATPDPTCMLALWLVGFEEAGREESGEICVAELYGHSVGPYGSSARIGIKAHHDPRLREDMMDVDLDIDATDWHTYAAAWTAHSTEFSVDGTVVRIIDQGMAYPLQLMIDLFEFPTSSTRHPSAYPKIGDVAAVRGYRPVNSGSTAPQGSPMQIRR